MGFLSEENSARNTMKWSHSIVNSLVHISVAGRGKNLPTGLTRILTLFQLLVALLMGLVVAPQREGLRAEDA
jgi:hypothetical protein